MSFFKTTGYLDLDEYLDKYFDKKIEELKVRIPQEQINNAVVKFFTEKKWFLTEDGKKLDTYDLIRKFAMNTIGVAENGELNPEFLKIVQQEVANIIAKEGLKLKNMYNYNECITQEPQTQEPAETDFEEYPMTEANSDFEDGYEQGWNDYGQILVTFLNSYFKEYGIKAEAAFNEFASNIYITNADGTVFSFYDNEEYEEYKDKEDECKNNEAENENDKPNKKYDLNNLSPEQEVEIISGITEELLGKKLNEKESKVLKSVIQSMNQIFKKQN